MSHAPASGNRHRAESAVLFILAAAIAAAGCADLAAGHLQTAVPWLSLAATTAISGLLLRLNWRLIEVNRSLIAANAELLSELAVQESSLPQWLGRFN